MTKKFIVKQNDMKDCGICCLESIIRYYKGNIPLEDVAQVMGKYLPTGILGMINHYTTGIFATILSWAYVVIMAIFWFYITKTFFKRNKL